jgi:hypothetical protein
MPFVTYGDFRIMILSNQEHKEDIMRVNIDRNVCPAHLAFCEQCLGKFLKEPLGYERRCFVEFEDDDPETLTVDLHTGETDIHLTLNETQRRLLAGEGWSHMLNFVVPQYRNNRT